MIANHLREEVPLGRLPTERHGRCSQKVTRRFVARRLTAVDVNGMELRCRLKNSAQFAAAQPMASANRHEPVVEREREASDCCSPTGMPIHRTRCRAQPCGRRRFNRVPVRKTSSPLAPKTAVTTHVLPVLLYARPTSCGNGMTQ